jgi:hypothetical protein
LVPTGYQGTVCSSAGSTLRALVEPTRAGVADEAALGVDAVLLADEPARPAGDVSGSSDTSGLTPIAVFLG